MQTVPAPCVLVASHESEDPHHTVKSFASRFTWAPTTKDNIFLKARRRQERDVKIVVAKAILKATILNGLSNSTLRSSLPHLGQVSLIELPPGVAEVTARVDPALISLQRALHLNRKALSPQVLLARMVPNAMPSSTILKILQLIRGVKMFIRRKK